jgi:hypothetical protein
MRHHITVSSQRLSPRTIRRIGRATGLGNQIVRGWAHGGYIHDFVTTTHRHGWFDLRTGGWGWVEDPICYTSCRALPALR